MRAFLLQHYTCDRRHGLISAENTKVDLPKAYWNLLGIVDIKNGHLNEQLDKAEELLEISEEMFEKVPELNQLVGKE